MANKPLHMDQIKRLLELKSEGCSIKKIARIMGLSKNTVRKYLRMASELSPQEENEVLKVGVEVKELSSQERRESEGKRNYRNSSKSWAD
jgi:predicted transcriptional regulator